MIFFTLGRSRVGNVVPLPPAESVASAGVMLQCGRAGSEGEEEEEEEDATKCVRSGMHFWRRKAPVRRAEKAMREDHAKIVIW